MASAVTTMAHLQTNILYECSIKKLTLHLETREIDMTAILSNGRANYILFENLTGMLTGLLQNSQGGKADLKSEDGMQYEVKSYPDIDEYPSEKFDLFHTAASSTFGPNNKGPFVKKCLADGDYSTALEICKNAGYNHTDFFVYTNTAKFKPSSPFRFTIVPKAQVLELLDQSDPRLISRQRIMSLCTETIRLC
jgi:hypothetical protein